jgi:glycine oxidase
MAGVVRVAIVGGGVIGFACAAALAGDGVRVDLIERGEPGGEASSAAAGILGAQLEGRDHAHLLKLLVQARAQYPEWAAQLREESGVDIGYRQNGVIRIARTEQEHQAVSTEVDWQRQQGLSAELLGPQAARDIEPEIAPSTLSAAYFADDAQVDPPSLMRALVRVADRRGVVVHRESARWLVREGGRCVGVKTDTEELRSDAVVIAAGSWSSLLGGMPSDLPVVRPARGQIVLLEERPERLRTTVAFGNAYAVPRGDGRVVCGSTMEFVGYRSEVTAAGVQAILAAALGAVPALEGAKVARSWSGLRPYVEPHVPLVGASAMPGLFMATGHFRNGILLAKSTADAICESILGA